MADARVKIIVSALDRATKIFKKVEANAKKSAVQAGKAIPVRATDQASKKFANVSKNASKMRKSASKKINISARNNTPKTFKGVIASANKMRNQASKKINIGARNNTPKTFKAVVANASKARTKASKKIPITAINKTGKTFDNVKAKAGTVRKAVSRPMSIKATDNASKAFTKVEGKAKATRASASKPIVARVRDQASKGFNTIKTTASGAFSTINKSTASSNKTIGKMGSKIADTGGRMKDFGRNSHASMAMPLMTVAGVAGYTGVTFDKQMSMVRSVTGATGKDFNLLETQAKQLGASTVFSATEAAEGQEMLARANWEVSDITKGLGPIMKMAAADQMGLGDAADITSNIMSSFNAKASETIDYTDGLAYASASSNTDITQIGEAMVEVSSNADAMGWSFEETTAAVMAFADKGIKGSKAGAAFGTSINRLNKPTGEAAKLMKKLNLNFDDGNGNMKSLSGIVAELEDKTHGLNNSQKKAVLTTLFGNEAFKHWNTLMGVGSEELKEMTKNVGNADGQVDQMYETMTDNAWGAIQSMLSAISAVGIEFTQSLVPYIEKATGAIQKFANWLERTSSTSKKLMAGIALLVISFGPLVLMLGHLSWAFGNVMRVFSNFNKVMTATKIAFSALTSPIGITIIALGALVTAGILVYKNWDTIKEKTAPIWQGIANIIKPIVSGIRNFIQSVMNAIKAFWSAHGEQIKETASNIWNGVKNIISPVLEAIRTFIYEKITQVKMFWDENGEQIKEATFNIWNGIKAVVMPIVNFIGNFITAIANKVKTFWGENGEQIKESTSIVWEKIKSAISITMDVISQVISIGMEVIKSIMDFVWPLIEFIIVDTWENIKRIINGALDIILGIVKVFSSLFTGDWTGLWEGIKQILHGAVQVLFGWVNLFFIGKILKVFKVFGQVGSSVIRTAWNVIKKIFNVTLKVITTVVKTGFRAIKVVISTVMNVIKAIIRTSWNIIKSIISGVVKVIRTVVTTAWNAIKRVTSTVFNAVKNIVSTIWNGIKTAISTVVNIIKTVVTTAWNVVKKVTSTVFNATKKVVLTIWNKIKTSISRNVHRAKTIVNKVWFLIKKITTTVFNSVRSFILKVWTRIKNIISRNVNRAKNIVSKVWNLIKSITTKVFNAVRRFISNIWNRIKNTMSDKASAAKNGMQKAWNKAKDKTKEIFDKMKNKIKDTWDDIVEGAKELPGKIGDGIKNMSGKAMGGIKHLSNKMLEKLGDGVNGVIGGVNWVLKKIGVKKKNRLKKWDVPQYAKGTDGHPGGPAIVGDGGGSELIQTPNRQLYLSPATDTLIPNMPKGTQVLPHKETMQFLSMGIPAYAGGIGSTLKKGAKKAVGGAKKAGKAAWSGTKKAGKKVKDIGIDVFDYMTKPKKLLDKVLSKMGVKSPKGIVGGFGKIARNSFTFVKNKAKDYIKKKFDSFMSFSGKGGSKSVKRWIAKAVAITGVPSSWRAPLETIAMKESGGNPKAINLWDINAKRGIPSKGLMQTIGPTFHAFKKKGMGNIWNPVHNAVAAINYIKSRYGTVFNTPGIKSMRRGGPYKGYANGGIIRKEQLAWLGEGNKEEAVIPLTKPKRAIRVLGYVMNRMGLADSNASDELDLFKDGHNIIVNNNNVDDDLKEDNKQIIELLKVLIDKVDGKGDTTFNMNNYWQQAEPTPAQSTKKQKKMLRDFAVEMGVL